MMNNSYEYMAIDDTSYHMLKASAATEITRKAVFSKRTHKDNLIAINKAIEDAAKAGRLRIDYTFKGWTEVDEDDMSCIIRFLLSCGYTVLRLNGNRIRIEWNP